MIEIVFLRHGQTDWNLEGRWQGATDVPLNLAGVEQAKAVRDQLRGLRFSRIYSSDLERARRTAELVSDEEQGSSSIILEPRLREISMGDWEGVLGTEIPTRWPIEWKQWRDGVLDSKPPKGESVLDVMDRCRSFLESIYKSVASEGTEESILVVSHKITISCCLAILEDREFSEIERHSIEHCKPYLVRLTNIKTYQ